MEETREKDLSAISSVVYTHYSDPITHKLEISGAGYVFLVGEELNQLRLFLNSLYNEER